MAGLTPITELDARYSVEHATATSWTEAMEALASAEVYWLSTVRPDGRPHVTPLIAVWVDDALYFSTGEEERKRLNLADNPHCALTTGCNTLDRGLDIVVEGDAIRVISESQLRRIVDAYVAKYGETWRFDVQGDSLVGKVGNVAWLFRVEPVTAFGFGKGDVFSQTRWRF
jgi:formylmethanofuran:tetrahydromethanopterin formyltransferase